jgi:peptidoglycan/LPS O-acetylase OafA/YrhL
VEGLRAIAVLAAVLYHAHVGLLGGGYVGVDVFFVLSGFLITGLLFTTWLAPVIGAELAQAAAVT